MTRKRGGGRGRAAGYRPPRSQREHITAAAGVLVVVVFTVITVWALGPHPDGGSNGGDNTPTVASTSTSLGDTTTTTVAPG